MPPKISICIAAFNEELKIEPAIQSARACSWCDELLVFDSGSTDATVEIARRYAHRVEFHKWVDYATSKRNMTEAAANDWVFILDADEVITPELAAEVAHLTDEQFRDHPVMLMRRRNYILGRHVRAWDPDWQNRLIDRRRVHWPDRAVHDERKPTEGTTLRLRSAMLHNPMADAWTDYFDGPRYQARTDALAAEMFRSGRRVGFLGLWLRPGGAFLKSFFIKRGFLDGTFGLLIAQKSAVSVQLKYAKLWRLQQEAERHKLS